MNCDIIFPKNIQLKLKKTSKYNLSDDEEDGIVFDQPHLSEKDDFVEEVPLDDDEDADTETESKLFHTTNTSSFFMHSHCYRFFCLCFAIIYLP